MQITWGGAGGGGGGEEEALKVTFLHLGATKYARLPRASGACSVPVCADSWLALGVGGEAEGTPVAWQVPGSLAGLLETPALPPVCADCRGNLKAKRTTSPALKTDASTNYSEITKALGLFSVSSEERKTQVFKMQAFSGWECVLRRQPLNPD